MAPSTPQPTGPSEESIAHQALLDQMDIAHLPKPFRNPAWKPSQRRNKNIRQMISETQRREAASIVATKDNSGASTPYPAPGLPGNGGAGISLGPEHLGTSVSAAGSRATTPASQTPQQPQPQQQEQPQAARHTTITQAAHSLDRLVLEKNLQRYQQAQLFPSSISTTLPAPPGAPPSTSPAITYTNIESAPSLRPGYQKRYCDITGLEARYTDPKSRLRYHDKEIFGVVRGLPPGAAGGENGYLAARGANVVLK